MTGDRIVCSACMDEACAAGDLMCEDARAASLITLGANGEPLSQLRLNPHPASKRPA